MTDFTTIIDRAVGPLHASARRRRAMQAELLAHLNAAYAEELQTQADPIAAAREAHRRFGDIDELRNQLQASVPIVERVLCRLIRKEILMSGWIWTVGWLVLLACMIPMANEMRLPLIAVALIGAIGIARLTRGDDSVTRWLGPRWGWRAFAVLFGMSIILPALAKLKHGQQDHLLNRNIATDLAIALSLGGLIVLIGIVSTVRSVSKRFSATA